MKVSAAVAVTNAHFRRAALAADLLNNFLLSINEQDTSHKYWNGNLAGVLMLAA